MLLYLRETHHNILRKCIASRRVLCNLCSVITGKYLRNDCNSSGSELIVLSTGGGVETCVLRKATFSECRWQISKVPRLDL